MNAAKRIQLNLKLEQNSKIPELAHVHKSTMIPIYYAEQAGKVDAHLANEFKSEVFTVRYGVMGGLWAVMGLAGMSHIRGGCSRVIKQHIPYAHTLGRPPFI